MCVFMHITGLCYQVQENEASICINVCMYFVCVSVYSELSILSFEILVVGPSNNLFIVLSCKYV